MKETKLHFEASDQVLGFAEGFMVSESKIRTRSDWMNDLEISMYEQVPLRYDVWYSEKIASPNRRKLVLKESRE